MEEDGVEPPEPEGTRFTVWPATTYGILFLIFVLYVFNACPGTRTPIAITATLVFKTSLLPIRVDRHTGRE